MAIAVRMAQTRWEGPLASGTRTVRIGSGATGELPVTWAARTERADGKTSPEELAAAAHSACYAMALALRLGERKAVPQRLAITATVTLDQAGGLPAIVSSQLDVTARVPGLGKTAFDTVVALTAALASGAVLASTYRWDGQLTASAVVAAGLVAVTVAAVAQARRVTRLRQDALRGPASAELTAKVRRGARSAAARLAVNRP
jgi:lipoyl-dependent peroxiredoxin